MLCYIPCHYHHVRYHVLPIFYPSFFAANLSREFCRHWAPHILPRTTGGPGRAGDQVGGPGGSIFDLRRASHHWNTWDFSWICHNLSISISGFPLEFGIFMNLVEWRSGELVVFFHTTRRYRTWNTMRRASMSASISAHLSMLLPSSWW